MDEERSSIVLIFDLDNTVIYSHIDFRAIRLALIEILHKYGSTFPTEMLVRHAIPELVAMGEHIGPEVGKAMWEVVMHHERAGLEGATLVEHAPEVLNTLKGWGYRLALLTNNGRAAVEEVLHAFGLAGTFEVVVSREDVHSPKPSPEGITLILNRLRGSPALAYMIGDAWIDGLAAQRAGVRFIAFQPREEDLRSRGIVPWAVIQDLRELLRFFPPKEPQRNL
ncbi:MAG: HAD-IA family hydrolase [Armatimonadota bacterium]|nr:HAD-IA family hydrolase [Armatimonadota bacterium]MDR5704168.1 HAD-IA family hydrolase [Armatimonadota bacterium]